MINLTDPPTAEGRKEGSRFNCLLFPLLSSDKLILIHSLRCVCLQSGLALVLVIARYWETGCHCRSFGSYECLELSLLFPSLSFSSPSFFASSSSPSIQTGLIDGLICGTNANRGSRARPPPNCLLGGTGTEEAEEEGRKESNLRQYREREEDPIEVGWASKLLRKHQICSIPTRTDLDPERKSLDAARNEKVSRSSSSSAAAFSDD